MSEAGVQVKDIIILNFLDSIVPDKNLSQVLGAWYLTQLNTGLQHKDLELYILNQYLPTLGYTPENIQWFKDEYVKFEMAYAQSLMDSNPLNHTTEELVESQIVQEEIKEEIIQQVQEKILDPLDNIGPEANHLEKFLITNLGQEYHQYIPQVVEWAKTQDELVWKDYVFKQWLPSFLSPERVYELVSIYITGSIQPKVEEISQPTQSTQPTQQVQIQEEQYVEQETQPDTTGQTPTQTGYTIDLVVPSNLEEMRAIEKEVEERLKKLSLMKEPYLFGENYVNDSYKVCPSFQNLIAPVQKAIIAKREQKANEKWFEKYRPELFEEILFPNQVIKETIGTYVAKGHIDGNCLFYGTGGVGKTTTNQVLMNAVLQNTADRFFLDRKIESVDTLKGWLNKKPIGKQKIVIAEEFDRLSDAAMTELKNGLMEKYEYVVFLASTNKIHKIDEALLTRFTLISRFETAQVSDLMDKCRYILTNERIQFTNEDLEFFVDQNKLKGIRTILNNLQLSCYMGVFEPKRTSFFVGDSGTEYDLIAQVKWYINYLIQLPKENLWYLSYDINQDVNVAKVRGLMLETLLANYSLNYDYIFMELLKDNIFLPIKNCLNVYYQDIDSKRIRSMHFEAMLNEFITIMYTTKDVYIR